MRTNDHSRLELENGDFVRYVEEIARRQQAELMRLRDPASAKALREAMFESPDRDGDGVSLRDLVGALSQKTQKTGSQSSQTGAAVRARQVRSAEAFGRKLGRLFAPRDRRAPSRAEPISRERIARVVFVERFFAGACVLGGIILLTLDVPFFDTNMRAGDILTSFGVFAFFHSLFLAQRR